MALDAAKDGVRVNAVNPSFTKTGMTEDMLKKPELVARFEDRMPLGAPEDPDGVAAAMAFLASADARLITGVNLPVDAGLMASNCLPPAHFYRGQVRQSDIAELFVNLTLNHGAFLGVSERFPAFRARPARRPGRRLAPPLPPTYAPSSG